jgi:DNA-binding XRE family transcriptional regulator
MSSIEQIENPQVDTALKFCADYGKTFNIAHIKGK